MSAERKKRAPADTWRYLALRYLLKVNLRKTCDILRREIQALAVIRYGYDRRDRVKLLDMVQTLFRQLYDHI